MRQQAENDRSSPVSTVATRSGRVLLLLAVILIVLPFVVVGTALVVRGGPAHQSSDRALIAIAARDALGLGQRLGPYSRFGWHHPGPGYFYLLAVPVWMLGSGTGTEIGAVVIGLASALAILALAHHLGGRLASLWSAGALGLLFAGPPAAIWRDPWNPYVIIFPMAAVLVGAGGATLGDGWSWAVALLAGTFVVQTHVGTLPAVVAAVALAGSTRAVSRFRRRHSGSLPAPSPRVAPHHMTLVTALGVVLAAAWAPVLVDQLWGSANLSQLWKFFVSGHPGHSGHEAWRTVASVGAMDLGVRQQFHDGSVPPHPLALSLVFFAIAATTILLGWRRRKPLSVALAAVAVVASLVSVVAAMRVVGPLYKFLVLWVSVIPVPLVIGLAHAVDRQPRSPPVATGPTGASGMHRRPKALLTIVAAVVPTVLGASAIASAITAAPVAGDDHPEIGSLWRLASGVLDKSSGPVRIEILAPEQWGSAAGLALDSERHGIPVRVEPAWTFMFGASRRCTGRERQVLLVANAEPRTWPDGRSNRFVGNAGATSLFVPFEASQSRPRSPCD